MYINKLDRNQSTHEYDILCHRLYPWKDVVVPPFGSLWGIIEPGHIITMKEKRSLLLEVKGL
jgi:hypothetical protein